MKPGVFGREIIMLGTKFMGFNIGYDYVNEHEGGTILKLVQSLNDRAKKNVEETCNKSFFKSLFVSRKVDKEIESISKWDDTKYRYYVVMPSVPYVRKEIVINNKLIRKKYTNFLLEDGEYTFLSFDEHVMEARENWENIYGYKTEYTESDWFYMPYYQKVESKTGYIVDSVNGKAPMMTTPGVAGQWSSRGFQLFIEDKRLADAFCETLANGNLAIVDSVEHLFQSKGCCFINLEEVCVKAKAVSSADIDYTDINKLY